MTTYGRFIFFLIRIYIFLDLFVAVCKFKKMYND